MANKNLDPAASPSFASGMFLRRLSETWQTLKRLWCTQLIEPLRVGVGGGGRKLETLVGTQADKRTDWLTDCVWGLNPDPNLEPGQSELLGFCDPSEDSKQLPRLLPARQRSAAAGYDSVGASGVGLSEEHFQPAAAAPPGCWHMHMGQSHQWTLGRGVVLVSWPSSHHFSTLCPVLHRMKVYLGSYLGILLCQFLYSNSPIWLL